MIVYSLTKEQYKNELSGVGAELFGGRWNSKGLRVIYTCESRALCTTEIAVHTPLGIMPKDYFLQTIDIPDKKQIQVELKSLHPNWNNFPHILSTKKIGNKFITESKMLTMKIPSAIIQDEFNYLINPKHKNFNLVRLIKVEEFKFDKRLFIK